MELKTFYGNEIIPFINDLAKLRIEIFRDYPYLYDGNYDYELNYLQNYVKSPNAFMVIVFDNGKMVGASTALPMRDADQLFQAPFIKFDFNLDEIFYFGESLLQKPYRGRNLYREFFSLREKAAIESNCNIATFCAVDRAHNDPRRPKDYIPLDNIWNKLGYEKDERLVASFSWKDIAEENESLKTMTFWLKYL